jgi:hypothetical protein
VKHIHIVGAPRSGTTLLLELMTNGFAFEAWSDVEQSLLEPPPCGVETYCSKQPGDHRVGRLFLAASPGLHVLALVRDPRDVVVSRHAREPDRYWTNLRMWRHAQRNLARLRRHPRVVGVRYEALVTDPDAVQREIAARLPFLTQQDSFSRCLAKAKPSAQSLRALGGVRPVDPASIGAWRRHLPRLQGQLVQHGPITDELIALGYERDAAWTALLEGVEPDLAPSKFPEHQPSPRSRIGRRALARALARSWLARWRRA